MFGFQGTNPDRRFAIQTRRFCVFVRYEFAARIQALRCKVRSEEKAYAYASARTHDFAGKVVVAIVDLLRRSNDF